MTLSAWVYPTAAGNVWRTVMMKEVPGELSYVLYANEDVDVPAAYVRIGSDSRRVGGASTLPLNAWTHLAATYDGSNLAPVLQWRADQYGCRHWQHCEFDPAAAHWWQCHLG